MTVNGDNVDNALSSTVKTTGSTGKKRPVDVAKDDTHVGQVLRTVYQRAVDEDIPSEMLDLLSKLG